MTGMVLLFAFTGTANAALVYADSLVATSPDNIFNASNPTVNGFDQDGDSAIDSSGDITGAPNGGGLFLSEAAEFTSTTDSWIDVQLAETVMLGAGADLQIFDWDINNTNTGESASVWVKTSIGDTFARVGTVTGGSLEGLLDINPADFSGFINYVRIEGIDGQNALDIEAIAGLHTAVIPLPPAVLLFGSGLLGLVVVARKRSS